MKMSIETKEVDTGQTAYNVLMAKAEQLRKRFPHLSQAQAFEKVYVDPANQALTRAERRGSGMYANDCKLEDATAVAKAALDTVVAPKPAWRVWSPMTWAATSRMARR
jgi:hypothetical protein